MLNRHIHSILLFLLATVLLAAIGCGRHSEVWKRMDLADSIMESRPDSALTILNDIALSDLHGKEEKARYALLKSIALDKNYVDTTTFDILQPAIVYYPKHGTPDEKSRTFYYQGRIFQNRGEDASAMRLFIAANDLKDDITDTLLLARNLVAIGVLNMKQYKIEKFIQNNLEAAELYGGINRGIYEVKSYSNALDGEIILGNRVAADSLMSICKELVKQIPDGKSFLFTSYSSYIMEFGDPEEIKSFLDVYGDAQLSQDNIINFAYGYSKIGEYDKALDILSDLNLQGTIWDSLSYAAVKTKILESQGMYKAALDQYRDYSAMSERYQVRLMSDDLLFADERHQIEVDNLIKVQSRDRVIGIILCSLFGVLFLSGWLYYRYRLVRSKRLIAEKENENLLLEQERIILERDKKALEADNLRLEQENLRKEKEMAEAERDKKALQAASLEKEKQRLEAVQRQRELEAEGLEREKLQLEGERDNLRELLNEQKALSQPLQEVIKTRLDMLNSLLAKEISNNDTYAKPYNKWIESIRSDKDEFMNSTRLAFTASHPKFMDYLVQHGLTTDEINYLCLYAIGLRGKEVGEYIQLKRHYNVSSAIRKKLGIDEHETNIGLYIRREMNKF